MTTPWLDQTHNLWCGHLTWQSEGIQTNGERMYRHHHPWQFHHQMLTQVSHFNLYPNKRHLDSYACSRTKFTILFTFKKYFKLAQFSAKQRRVWAKMLKLPPKSLFFCQTTGIWHKSKSTTVDPFNVDLTFSAKTKKGHKSSCNLVYVESQDPMILAS